MKWSETEQLHVWKKLSSHNYVNMHVDLTYYVTIMCAEHGELHLRGGATSKGECRGSYI